MKKILPLFLILTILHGCKITQEEKNGIPPEGNKYALGFSVEQFSGYKILKVFRPWQQNNNGLSVTYILAKDPESVPDSLAIFPIITIPVKKVAALSSGYVAMISALRESGSLKAVSGSGFIFGDEIRDMIENHEIVDVGYDQQLNYEMLVNLDPDVLFLYGVDASVQTTVRKLNEMGIPAVICSDYLETEPLGKSEWIKFISEFYDKREAADSVFNGIEQRYLIVKKIAEGADNKPVVLSGIPWKDTWYVPGGRSFAAKYISDAGGNYLWKDDSSSEVIPLDLEAVYLKALKADIWINPGDAGSLKAIRDYDDRFTLLPAFQNGEVYNNNLRINDSGGNDYWESGILYPDLILSDLVGIFHPGLIPGHCWTYYKKLK